MVNGIVKSIARMRKPLKRRRNAVLAAVAGLLLGSIGVGLYLRSLLDFLIATTLTMCALIGYVATGVVAPFALFYVIAAPLYGFHRVRISNAKLAQTHAAISPSA
jgi:hypothetical protein